ncbi:MAG: hypothetical protein ACLSD6_05385 [Clostridium sp.]
MEDDSVKLLRECNAGIKMGISSIDDVMEDGATGSVLSRATMTFTSPTTLTKC